MYRDEIALVTAVGGAGLLIVVVWWVMLSIAIGVIATERKRFFVNWFAAGLLFSPFFAVLLLIAAGDADELPENERSPVPRD